MYHLNIILIFLCVWVWEGNSELFYKDKNLTQSHDDPCINSDILVWENEVHATLKNGTGDPVVNATRKDGRGGRGGRRRGKVKNPVMVRLLNKRRRRKLVNIKPEGEYKIDIMNRLQKRVEVLLIVDFLSKSDCGVGALFKDGINAWSNLESNDSSICYSVQSSIEPRMRVKYSFHAPKCGCFIFRYPFASKEGNATVIRSPDPTSLKLHKRLSKTFCVKSEKISEGEEGIPAKKNQRRGKKGFSKQNRRMNRREKEELRHASAGSSSEVTLSRSKKDTFQILEAQGRHTARNPSFVDINKKDNVNDLSENRHEFEIIENEIPTDEIYNYDLPEKHEVEELDEYEIEDEDQSIESEERNLIEDFEYEDDDSEDDEKYVNDYEQEDFSVENDSESDEVENEVNYDENIHEYDDVSKENDEIEYDQYNSLNMGADNLSDIEIYERDHFNQEKTDKNCDSDESDESSEEHEDEVGVINDNEEVFEKENTITRKYPLNSINNVYNERNEIGPRPNFRRQYENKMRQRHSFPRRRLHNFRNIRRQNPSPGGHKQPFKPWEDSNRAKWQRKHEINVNKIKASSICCRQGVNRKKLILHNKLENNSEFNKTCDEFPQKILSWVEETFNFAEEFCRQKFSICCEDWSLLSSDFRVPYYPTRRKIFV